jgi:hypothetical protein
LGDSWTTDSESSNGDAMELFETRINTSSLYTVVWDPKEDRV